MPCGTTGETPTLTEAEQLRVVELVVAEAKGRVPVLAGAGGYNTHEVIEAAQQMARAGADGILSVDAVLQQADSRRSLPALQSHRRSRRRCRSSCTTSLAAPASTSMSQRLVRLSAMSNIVGVKEASGNMTQMCEICAAVPSEFLVLSGDDALTLPVMAVEDAASSRSRRMKFRPKWPGWSSSPKRGDFAGARRMHHELMPLMQINFIESSPIPVKAAMAMMGLVEEVYRLPLVPPRPPSRDRIANILRESGAANRSGNGPRLSPQASAHTPYKKDDRVSDLASEISALFEAGASADRDQARDAFSRLRAALSAGTVRAAEPDPSAPSGWRVNAWVKQGILLGFRVGVIVDMSADHGSWPFVDKDTLPLKRFAAEDGIRIVPGGSTVRDGAYLGQGVVCMPPMYINIGAYVGNASMIDSHALVGSCAQIGQRVHVSAAAQIGGVLEPVGALPVVIEDDVLDRRKLRRVRRCDRETACRPCVRHGVDRIDAALRSPERHHHRAVRRSARCARRRRRGARDSAADGRQSARVGPLGLDADHREIPRRTHRCTDGAGRGHQVDSAAFSQDKTMTSPFDAVGVCPRAH